MAVTSPHIWYPSGVAGTGVAYDLRKITSWVPLDPNPNDRVLLRFIGDTVTTIEVDLSDFETAKQASVDAGG